MNEFIGIGINTLVDTIKGLNTRARTKDVNKARVIRELRYNLQVLSHKNKDGVSYAGIIKSIKNDAISKAVDEKFNFNTLRKGKIGSKILYHDRIKKYKGWSATRMIDSIDGKIAELKQMPVMYNDFSKAPVNLKLRLSNLYYQMKLLADFINEKK